MLQLGLMKHEFGNNQLLILFFLIQSSVIPSTSKAFDYRPLFRDETVNVDPSLIETPIHEPLREMGFDSILISEAIR